MTAVQDIIIGGNNNGNNGNNNGNSNGSKDKNDDKSDMGNMLRHIESLEAKLVGKDRQLQEAHQRVEKFSSRTRLKARWILRLSVSSSATVCSATACGE